MRATGLIVHARSLAHRQGALTQPHSSRPCSANAEIPAPNIGAEAQLPGRLRLLAVCTPMKVLVGPLLMSAQFVRAGLHRADPHASHAKPHVLSKAQIPWHAHIDSHELHWPPSTFPRVPEIAFCQFRKHALLQCNLHPTRSTVASLAAVLCRHSKGQAAAASEPGPSDSPHCRLHRTHSQPLAHHTWHILSEPPHAICTHLCFAPPVTRGLSARQPCPIAGHESCR